MCSKVEGVSGVTTWAQQVLVSRSVTTKITLRAFEGFSGAGWGLVAWVPERPLEGDLRPIAGVRSAGVSVRAMWLV